MGSGIYFSPYKIYDNNFSQKGDDGFLELFLNLRNPLILTSSNPAIEILYNDIGLKKFAEKVVRFNFYFLNYTNILGDEEINSLDMTLEEMGKDYFGLDDDFMNYLREKVSDVKGSNLLVLPSELADTLHSLSIPKVRSKLGNFTKNLTTMWKTHTLYFPTRNPKYFIRNLLGDLDAVIAGNPSALFKVKQAITDLYHDFYGDNSKVSSEFYEFQKRGGAVTMQSSQELYDYKQLREFKNLISELDDFDAPAWKKFSSSSWRILDKILGSGIIKANDFRESILRYACYLDYLRQMQNDKNGLPNNFGASVHDEIISIPDIRDRAFKLANELVGAYDQISASGKELRDILVPFYSWIEVNAKRYWQLIRNGLSRNPKDFVSGRFLKGQLFNIPYYGFRIAQTYIMINLLSALISAFNHFVFPDDEENLPPDIKSRTHILLGNDGQGNIRYFDRVGNMLDNLEWFGQDDSPFFPFFNDVKDIFNNKMSVTDWINKISTSLFNKSVNSLNPIFKLPLELAFRRTSYPDATNPAVIRDRFKYLAQSFGLTWPYKLASGEVLSNWNEFKKLFFYLTDADEAAYFYTLSKVREFQEKVLHRKFDGFSTTQRGEVLRNIKSALRLHDKSAAERYILDYAHLGGTGQGLKNSLQNMHPLHSLSARDKKRFFMWLSDDDKKFFNRAEKYYKDLQDRLIK